MLEVQNISINYGVCAVVEDVSFSLRSGKNHRSARRERRGKNDAFEIFEREFADGER